ncbi:flagellar assembly protein FliH [Neobacillus sp. YIM B02564]|uniref:Flagellar assembly protein FliH n=1 Tax=Neobacillus paridis TaxID=2803862 RepID=A0ABS1TNN3_9BACI|nr:flagellar assembly protein FliH [Neobacillus paridis]MBL4952951.1 flagellar assembly protein FliH [Neobacillus paridis]
MMASYSKIFKAANVSITDEVKVITPVYIPANSSISTDADEAEKANSLSNSDANLFIQEAEEKAQAIIQEARNKAQAIETAAEERINQWWTENNQKLEEMSLAAKEEGFQAGYISGQQEATAKVEQAYREKLTQAGDILQQAYEQKKAIISEAEPFLLELSTVIASQIIKQELEEYPDKFIELIKQHILRFKEKEHITICVNPDDYPYIQSQRSHLISVVNGETEIKIIPDYSVAAKGCVIRTEYGSIDARIDTQMEEIKRALLEARKVMQHDTVS